MKLWIRILSNVLYVFTVIYDVAELLLLPALFAVIGLWNGFPWQFYAVTIGGYFALLALFELIAHLIFKALDKKYTPLIQRTLEKIFGKSDDEC